MIEAAGRLEPPRFDEDWNAMTKHLEQAVTEMRALPEPDQDALAQFILEVVAERKFDRLLESDASLRVLEKMAQAALEEHRQGETIDLDDLSAVERARDAGVLGGVSTPARRAAEDRARSLSPLARRSVSS